METKTFLETRVNTDVYGELVPESLQETINAWFDSRYVCDDTNFVRFFQRILKRDYHRYNELLRIEAGAKYDTRAGYDWLVNSYLEREVKVDGERHEEDNRTTTFAPKAQTSTQEVSVIKFGGTSKLSHGLKSETTYGRKDDTSIESLSDEGSSQSSNTSATAKDLPGSVVGTYAGSTVSDVSFDGQDISVTLGRNDSFDSELNLPTAISKGDANSVNRAIRNGSSETINQASGKDTTQNSGDDETVKGGQDETQHTTIITRDGEDTTGVEGSNDATHSDTTHEIYTGRSGAPAEMLVKAREYIESTSAWEWFKRQLEPCFIGVYDV